MTATLDLVSNQALSLPEHERMALAHRLLKSVDEAPATDNDAAWEAVIARRLHEYETGKVKTHSAAEFFARLDAALPGK